MNQDQEIERDATSNTFLPLPPSSSIIVTEENQKFFFDHMKQGSLAIKNVITKDFIILYFRLIKILFQDFLPLLWLYPHQLWSHHHGDHSLRVTESVLRVSRRVMAGQQGDSVLPVVTRVTWSAPVPRSSCPSCHHFPPSLPAISRCCQLCVKMWPMTGNPPPV